MRREVVLGPDLEARWRRASEIALADSLVPFDVAVPPLMRAALVDVADDLQLVVVSLDHLVADAWSVAILVDEFIEVADGLARGRDIPGDQEDSYCEVAVRRAQRAAGRGLHPDAVDEHTDALRPTIPLTTTPDDGCDPAELTTTTALLAPSVNEGLANRFGRDGTRLLPVGITAVMSVLAPVAHDVSYQVWTTMACREDMSERAVVGCLANLVPVRVRTSPGASPSDMVTRVRRALFAAMEVQSEHFESPTHSPDGITLSVQYLAATFLPSGTKSCQIARLPVENVAVSGCPTGATLDLSLVHGRATLDHPAGGLELVARSPRSIIGRKQLAQITERWAGEMSRIAGHGPRLASHRSSPRPDDNTSDVPRGAASQQRSWT